MTQDTPAPKWKTLSGEAPLIIAHRGASGVLPEHTLEAYARAIDMGADFIEPDLVITKDGYLVARHDRYLSTTTNVAEHPEFADRKTTKPGHEGADWFVEDFTLAEIQTLRAVQPRADRPQEYNGQFEIPTFDAILDLIKAADRVVGVYPETKQPSAFAAAGLRHDEALLESLEGFTGPVFIQSFEVENLKRLNEITDFPLVYLTIEVPDLSFYDISQFADGIGPYKALLKNEYGRSTGFIESAHAMGMVVHPWTFRDDQLDGRYNGALTEIATYMILGVDGIFTDFPDTGLRTREFLAIDSFKDYRDFTQNK